MKTFIISGLSALILAASMNVASVGVGNAQTFPACFRGDTMDRDGGHSGALGAPKCNGDYAQRIVVQAHHATA